MLEVMYQQFELLRGERATITLLMGIFRFFLHSAPSYIFIREKKFITGGIKAGMFVYFLLYSYVAKLVCLDYYTTAVRTGGDGVGGISFLVIEKNTPGITTRRLKTIV